MDHAKTMMIFEHPLNEKMRTWLRIEFLINQLQYNKNFQKNNALFFFHLLNDLMEIIERNDIRTDLLKNLGEQQQNLSIWLNVPGVDKLLLDELLTKLNNLTQELNFEPKFGQNLQDDRFIGGIRKRLTIPAGCCSFDVPYFHLWLQQPIVCQQQINEWLDNFSTLFDAISLAMQLIRQTSHFKPFSCSNHFYQDGQDDIALLRIKVPIDKQLYPQVSGNANRYAIRFLPLEPIVSNNHDPERLVEFELACC